MTATVRRAPRFQVYEDRAGRWRWSLESAKGEVIARGHDHPTRLSAVKAVNAARQAAARAVLFAEQE